jgi:hypothetical protein
MFFIISIVIAEIFMGVFGFSAQTLFMCYMVDDEVNDGAKSCPKNL